MTADGSSPEVTDALETTACETLDKTVEWTVQTAAEGYQLTLPDRRIVISDRDGPSDSLFWTITLRSDGTVVSKFGPYESIDSLLQQVRTVLTADVQYTVCCDG